jgi:hypothetical protein
MRSDVGPRVYEIFRPERRVSGQQILFRGSEAPGVTDCYRTSVPEPQQTPEGSHWAPCRDAEIWVRGDQVEVNGRDYGKIGAADSVVVDHGVVSVHRD